MINYGRYKYCDTWNAIMYYLKYVLCNIISYSEVGRALRLFKDIEKVSLLGRRDSGVPNKENFEMALKSLKARPTSL